MSRSTRELRRALAPITGSERTDARTAVPLERPQPIAQAVKDREAQLRAGYRKKVPQA